MLLCNRSTKFVRAHNSDNSKLSYAQLGTGQIGARAFFIRQERNSCFLSPGIFEQLPWTTSKTRTTKK